MNRLDFLKTASMGAVGVAVVPMAIPEASETPPPPEGWVLSWNGPLEPGGEHHAFTIGPADAVIREGKTPNVCFVERRLPATLKEHENQLSLLLDTAKRVVRRDA